MAQSGKKPSTSIYTDLNVQNLLGKFIQGKITTLEPVYSTQKGYSYPIVEELLDDPSQATAFLNHLYESGILERKVFDKTLSCPTCNSSSINFRYCCPFCKSFNIQKSSLIEHVKCGYMDIESKFTKNGLLICPKCNKELKQVDVDYRKAGVWCSCKDCNKNFDIPVAEHFCRDCHQISTFEEVVINDVYSYTPKGNLKADSSITWFFSSAITEFLIKEGFNVEPSSTVKGKSGASHTFDVVAINPKTSNVTVIDLSIAENCVSEQPVIALFAKIFDVSPEKAYLVAAPRINENAKKMAELYSIRVIEAKSPEEAVAALKEKMKPA